MNSDLMHSARVWFTENDTRLAVVAQLLEGGCALFALGRDFANTNLVAHHFDRFFTLDDASAEEEWKVVNKQNNENFVERDQKIKSQALVGRFG